MEVPATVGTTIVKYEFKHNGDRYEVECYATAEDPTIERWNVYIDVDKKTRYSESRKHFQSLQGVLDYGKRANIDFKTYMRL